MSFEDPTDEEGWRACLRVIDRLLRYHSRIEDVSLDFLGIGPFSGLGRSGIRLLDISDMVLLKKLNLFRAPVRISVHVPGYVQTYTRDIISI